MMMVISKMLSCSDCTGCNYYGVVCFWYLLLAVAWFIATVL